MNAEIYTIGHSNHSSIALIALLQQHGITAVADVRSTPYSRMQPQFNRESLKRALQEQGIAYVFLGKELGARSEQAECYIGGKVQFDILARQPLFLQGLDRLINGLNEYRISLLCAEKDPLDCHRTVLVARQLHNRGIVVKHIHYDGTLETHADVEQRLLETLKLTERNLFRSDEEIMADAYAQWGERIAYVAEPEPTDWTNR